MRRLHYAGGYVLLGDTTCKAVLRYARALARSGTSDVVSVPVVTEGGSRAYAHLLIGPASQVFSTPVENGTEEREDDEVIRELEEATLRLQPGRPSWPEEMADIPDLDFDGYDFDAAHDSGADDEDEPQLSAHTHGSEGAS